MKKIVLILSMFIASVSLVNATNVEPNTKKQDEPVKKEKVEKIIDPATICRYYAIVEANNFVGEENYGSMKLVSNIHLLLRKMYESN